MTTRHYLALDLHDDPELIRAYEEWHRPGKIPAGVTASIRNAGILNMEIWRAGNRLFMVMDTAAGFCPDAKASADMASPDVQAWERLMWEFQKPLPCAKDGEKWVPLTRIYTLAEQP